MERFFDNNATHPVFVVQLAEQCACESGFSLESFSQATQSNNRLNTVKCISFTPALISCGLSFPFDSDRDQFFCDLFDVQFQFLPFFFQFFFLIFYYLSTLRVMIKTYIEAKSSTSRRQILRTWQYSSQRRCTINRDV